MYLTKTNTGETGKKVEISPGKLVATWVGWIVKPTTLTWVPEEAIALSVAPKATGTRLKQKTVPEVVTPEADMFLATLQELQVRMVVYWSAKSKLRPVRLELSLLLPPVRQSGCLLSPELIRDA